MKIKWPFFTQATQTGTRLTINHNSKSIRFIFKDNPTYNVGDAIQIKGEFIQCIQSRNPGEFDYCNWLKKQGIHAQFKVNHHQLNDVTIVWPAIVKLSKIPRLIYGQFKQLFPKHPALIYTMIFGSRQNYVDIETKKIFSKLGLIHVLVVSGAQISLITVALCFIARIVHVPIIIAVTIVFMMQLMYMLIVGSDASILRAIIMTDSLLIHRYVMLKKYPTWWYILTSAVIIMIIDSNSILNYGFWYSFLITFSLIVIVPKLSHKIQGPAWFIQYVVASLVAVFSAFIIQMMILSNINFISITSNLWMAWVSTLVLFMGLISFVLFNILPKFGKGVGVLVDYSMQLLMDTLPLLVQSRISLSWNIINKVCFLITIIGLLLITKYKNKVMIILLIIMVNSIGWYINSQAWLLIAIDVGQGDATLIIDGNKTVLIDTGGVINNMPVAPRFIEPALNHYGINHIDHLIITHHDLDHIGGLGWLNDNYQIDNVYSPQKMRFNNHHIIQNGIIITLNNTVLYVSAPQRYMDVDTINNSSLIIHGIVRYNSHKIGRFFNKYYHEFNKKLSFLITGDLDIKGELAIIRQQGIPDIDILKLGHHGSRFSTSKELLSITSPIFVWNSSGYRNLYGHPHKETLKRLNEFEIPYLSTHKSGAIIMTLTKKFYIQSFLTKKRYVLDI